VCGTKVLTIFTAKMEIEHIVFAKLVEDFFLGVNLLLKNK
jgi:hypothetical protein